MDALVSPGTDAGRDQQIDSISVILCAFIQELQRAMNPTGLVAVDSAGHQHDGQLVAPPGASDRHQRVMVRTIRQTAILDDIKPLPQTLNDAQDVR